MPFEKGHKLSKGGVKGNKGGGRRPNDVRAKARKYFEQGKILEYWRDVALGKPTETMLREEVYFDDHGNKCTKFVKLKVAADVKDRLTAGKMVKEFGHGKDEQPVGITETKRLLFIFPEGSED